MHIYILCIKKGQTRTKPQFIIQLVNINVIKIECPLTITLFFYDKILYTNVSLVFFSPLNSMFHSTMLDI